VRYFFENYALDTDRRELQRGTGVVPTTPQVFDLLDYLIRNGERVVSKDDLVSAIWKGRIVSDAALTSYTIRLPGWGMPSSSSPALTRPLSQGRKPNV